MKTTESYPVATLTGITWESLPNHVLTNRPVLKSWMAVADLARLAAVKTADYCPLSFNEWQELVSACNTGSPLLMTWDSRRAKGWTYVTARITATVIVKSIHSLASGTTSNLYIRYPGFGHPISLANLVSVSVPATTYEERPS